MFTQIYRRRKPAPRRHRGWGPDPGVFFFTFYPIYLQVRYDADNTVEDRIWCELPTSVTDLWFAREEGGKRARRKPLGDLSNRRTTAAASDGPTKVQRAAAAKSRAAALAAAVRLSRLPLPKRIQHEPHTLSS